MNQISGLLEPLTIPLFGRHMIEASAGTGKTYNITRIYVRLLVESGLSVKQILVMTFTEAATEEIKDRLASFIGELLQNFYTQPCEYSKALQEAHGVENTFEKLSVAQLELDLAAIYTINGFCQRVIGRYGLSLSVPQNAELVVDFQKITLAYVTDALRALRNSPEDYILLQEQSFHDPSKFLECFGNLIGTRDLIEVPDEHAFLHACASEFNHCWAKHAKQRQSLITALSQQSAIFYEGVKTGAKTVQPEIDIAINWLSKDLLLEQDTAILFIRKWAGIEKTSDKESKQLVDELLNGSFNKLFSKRRIDNYLAAGLPANSPIIENANNLLADIKTSKGLSDVKKKLVSNIRNVPTYKLVFDLIDKINRNIEQHKQVQGVIGFNDQIEGVAKGLNQGGAALIDSLQNEYPAALVDEFQDTDNHQYSILEHLFPAGSQNRLLLMIGDPKQAIYSFRGGDIYTYLRAKENADFHWGMNVNYRSSESVIESYNRLFHGAPLHQEPVYLFDENIRYPLVKPPQDPIKLRLIDEHSKQGENAFTFICANALLEDDPQTPESEPIKANKDVQVSEILVWCAREARRLLADVYIEDDGNRRLVRSQDIAILVRSRAQAAAVKQVFSAHGLASVFLGEKTPLFESQQALDVLWLLQAVHQPTRGNVRQAITTGLVRIDDSKVSESISLLMDDNHPAWENVFSSLSSYRNIWAQKGVYALMQTVIQQALVEHEESERHLTNYMHVAELLASASVTNSSALLLIHWLHKQITDSNKSGTHELRLESDQKLIQIVTQHKSKGLEYPIVFLPFANHIYNPSSAHSAVFHNASFDRVTQLGVSSESRRKSEKEALAEDMRLLYVSLTRPILRCYLGVFTLASSNNSALMRALNITIDNKRDDNPSIFVRQAIKRELADISSRLYVTMANENLPIRQHQTEDSEKIADVLPFNTEINTMWQVTSFSKLSRVLAPAIAISQNDNTVVSSKIEFTRDAEEQASLRPIDINSDNKPVDKDKASAYCFDFPKGPDAGNLLHDILENLDFVSPDLGKVLELLDTSAVYGHLIDIERLKLWIEQILSCSLRSSDPLSLKDLKTEQTLKESEFYFPIHQLDTRAFMDIINSYRAKLSEHFGFEMPATMNIPKSTLEGAMHGFIDLIFEANGKYYVADYKSNYLGDSAQHYLPASLGQDIIKHHYDIQYLIYSLALHRYLKAFLPGYNYQEHFGGVYYLYLRGMGSDDNSNTFSQTSGVYYHNIEHRLISSLDDVFNENEDGAPEYNMAPQTSGSISK